MHLERASTGGVRPPREVPCQVTHYTREARHGVADERARNREPYGRLGPAPGGARTAIEGRPREFHAARAVRPDGSRRRARTTRGGVLEDARGRPPGRGLL